MRRILLSVALGFALGATYLPPSTLADVKCSGTILTCGGGAGGASVTANNTWSGTQTFLDNKFFVVDDGDATKKLAWQLSGQTTATTTTLKVAAGGASTTPLLELTGIWGYAHTDGTVRLLTAISGGIAQVGTTTNHPLRFFANGVNAWDVVAATHLVPVADNTSDIGSSTLRPRSIYFNTSILAGNEVLISDTAPTISSGFGTSPSISANNGTAAFRVNVGTGGTANSGVIGLPTATTGWNCFCSDITTQSATVYLCKQTASTTTTATVGNFDAAGAAAAWVASNILAVSCFAY